MYDVTKFICFTHHLLHLIQQSAEIEAKEIARKKVVIIVLKLVLQRVIIHIMGYKNLPLDNLISSYLC